ncbi:MAG: class I SAM-dependent methyltransferase [Deltaproteobacteria bacterium]|nr:class I SAM-dependent methyltransferase [Deltaproteobacteria bacterium]
MARQRHRHKKTYYNDIALRLAEQLLGLKHLHFGYFDEGDQIKLSTLPHAQEVYAQQLLGFVPQDVHRILDVGCGSGGMAKVLVQHGYEVTCIAPDPYLIQKTLENTSGKVTTCTDLYENVRDLPPGYFDLILMSESCQYVKVKEGWEQNSKYLRPGGYVLVSDFFKLREIARPNISKSGHMLDAYLQAADEQGYVLMTKTDITERVAPTMDIYNDLIQTKLFPVEEALAEFLYRRYPFLSKSVQLVFGKKISNLKEKYSNQSSEVFRQYKGYFILLFQKRRFKN